MAPEDDINLPINAQEGSTTPTLLLWLILLDRFSLWWGRQRLCWGPSSSEGPQKHD
jgi:hypothetical protein